VRNLGTPNIDKKYPENFETWCWRSLEKILWTDVKNGKVLRGVKEERNFLSKVKTRKADCIVHILHKNCLIKHVAE